MIRAFQTFPSVALIFGLLWATALFCGPKLRADDNAADVQSDQRRSYPARTADLEKWIQRGIIPGRTKLADIISIFGAQYRHPFAGFDSEDHMRRDNSLFVYDLDELGIHDHPPHYVLNFQFDARSGALLRTAVEEEERQTGFNINSVIAPGP